MEGVNGSDIVADLVGAWSAGAVDLSAPSASLRSLRLFFNAECAETQRAAETVLRVCVKTATGLGIQYID